MAESQRDIEGMIHLFRSTIIGGKWYETLGFLEFWFEHFKGLETGKEIVIKEINEVLEANLFNFRYVNGEFTRVAEPIQTMALESVSDIKLDGIRKLLGKAKEHLDKRPEPDIGNAIKDSAIALEQICKLLTRVDGQGISKPLAILSNKIQLNGALKDAIKNLYGYS
jgi:hypothetical protein